MSKHFQLLKSTAKEDVFDPPCISVETPESVVAPLPMRKDVPDTEITKLVQRLFLQGGKVGGPAVVSFSGITRDERSSWICARAGEALAAQVDGPVCIVEANLWSPQLHLQFSGGKQIGLAEALSNSRPIQSFATRLDGSNLWFICSGLIKPDPYTPLDRYRERFTELREIFSYILVSAPAFTREAEATFIGQLSDGIVLVVEANQTRRDTVRRAKEQLEGAQVKLLGAVLDQRMFPIPEKLYQRL